MRRSVTAELELEPGEYHVLVKIEAEKYDMSLPVEDVLRNNVKSRRDKLLRIGRAYDLAHAKGQILESNEEKARREKLEAQVKAKARKEMKEKLMKEKQRRKHVENKEARKAREAAAKRKAKAKAKEAAKKEQKGAEKCQEVNEKEQKGKEVSNETKEKVKPETAVAKDDDKTAKSDPSEVPPLSDAKVEDKTTGDSADGEPTAAKETEKNTSPAEETKESDPPTEKNNEKEDEKANENEKEKEAGSVQTTPPLEADTKPVPEISTSAKADDDDDDDDLSDIDSIVSDITVGVVDEAIEEADLAAKSEAAATPANDDEENDFEKDPWNAIAVVGLRVYSKGSSASIRVIRPQIGKISDKDSVAKLKREKVKLDVDDSAVDAATGEQKKQDIKPDVGGSEQDPTATKDGNAGETGGSGSEGSIIIV